MRMTSLNTLTELVYKHLYKCNRLLNAIGKKNGPLIFELFVNVSQIFRTNLIFKKNFSVLI